MLIAGSFYDNVLLELVTALGAAMFASRVLVFARRRSTPEREPLARTIIFLLIGFVVMIAGAAALIA